MNNYLCKILARPDKKVLQEFIISANSNVTARLKAAQQFQQSSPVTDDWYVVGTELPNEVISNE